MPNYFVYGALMGAGKFKLNGKRAKLKNHRIAFIVRGAVKWEPSFAALIESEGDTAWGVVAELSFQEWQKISSHEIAYETHLVEAQTNDGPVKARALVLVKPGYDRDVNPSRRYADMLYKSACFHGFPEPVQQQYLELRKRGLKHTYYMRHLFPFVRKLMPYMSPKKAIYLVLLGVPLLCLVVILLLLYLIL